MRVFVPGLGGVTFCVTMLRRGAEIRRYMFDPVLTGVDVGLGVA